MKLYTIYDKVAQKAAPPFTACNDAVALRMYNRYMKDIDVDVEDYELWFLADYDEKTMHIRTYKYKVVLHMELEVENNG